MADEYVVALGASLSRHRGSTEGIRQFRDSVDDPALIARTNSEGHGNIITEWQCHTVDADDDGGALIPETPADLWEQGLSAEEVLA